MLRRTIFIQNPCHLKCKNEQLVVSYGHVPGLEHQSDRTVPIEDIALLVLEHQQITITHYVLDKLVGNNVAVVTCGANHHPTGMLLPLESHTTQSERFKEQLEASEPLKKQLWQQTVRAKIANQAQVLGTFAPEKSRHLTAMLPRVKSGDTENHEGQAAAHYWKNLFPDAWQFFRHREGPPPNNLLNYGYAILRATMARSIAGAGLLPVLGIFHRNRYNAYCLADDLMEPYRPWVDLYVRSLVDTTSAVDTLTSDIKNKLLNVLTTDVLINDERSPLMVAMQRTAQSLWKCYAGEARKMAYPVME